MSFVENVCPESFSSGAPELEDLVCTTSFVGWNPPGPYHGYLYGRVLIAYGWNEYTKRCVNNRTYTDVENTFGTPSWGTPLPNPCSQAVSLSRHTLNIKYYI